MATKGKPKGPPSPVTIALNTLFEDLRNSTILPVIFLSPFVILAGHYLYWIPVWITVIVLCLVYSIRRVAEAKIKLYKAFENDAVSSFRWQYVHAHIGYQAFILADAIFVNTTFCRVSYLSQFLQIDDTSIHEEGERAGWLNMGWSNVRMPCECITNCCNQLYGSIGTAVSSNW